jgi:hypothetical protein
MALVFLFALELLYLYCDIREADVVLLVDREVLPSQVE